jgi:stage II sporulation SpoM-like protein
VSVNELVLTRGMRDTRTALERWNAEPWPVVGAWFAGGLAVAVLLLLAVWIVAAIATPEFTTLSIAGVYEPSSAFDIGKVLARNSLVLALHATACVAGFIAGSSLPLSAEKRTGFSRWLHEVARPIAMAWVGLVTIFSLTTQAYALGLTGSTLAWQFDMSAGGFILTALPHALVELTALFLPLAAWLIASRRDQWQDLLAATFATVAIAIPMLVAAATWEVYVWPQLIKASSPLV